MDYIKIIIPFIDKEIIKRKADFFRQKFWNNTIPVDIEKIIDVKLRINIIPIPGLEMLCDTNALITSDWTSIYVDKNLFEDERRLNRLRFSYAHEVGHNILHKQIYESFNINSIEKFYKFIDQIPGDEYGKLEIQSQIFANFLLVPRNILQVEKNRQYEKIKHVNIDEQLINSYISSPLAKLFGVCADTIEIALTDLDN